MIALVRRAVSAASVALVAGHLAARFLGLFLEEVHGFRSAMDGRAPSGVLQARPAQLQPGAHLKVAFRWKPQTVERPAQLRAVLLGPVDESELQEQVSFAAQGEPQALRRQVSLPVQPPERARESWEQPLEQLESLPLVRQAPGQRASQLAQWGTLPAGLRARWRLRQARKREPQV
jgi:hypothetical protein